MVTHGDTAPMGFTLYSGVKESVGFGSAPAVSTAAPANAAWARTTSREGWK